MRACLFALLLTMPVVAGTMFRIEIGPPVAAGTTVKLKGVAVAARAVLCDDPATVRVTATAESLVSGTRRSTPLQIVPVSTPGVFGITVFPIADQSQTRPTGAWLLHVKGTCASPKAEASSLIAMRDATYVREQVQVLREPATAVQIEAALRDASRD